MNLHLLPSPPYSHPVLLVDIFQGSLVSMLLGVGAREVWVVQGPRVAGIIGASNGILFGEREGLPLEGFHYSTSLDAARKLELGGQSCVVLAPSLYEAIGNSHKVLVGHFRNAKQALHKSRQQRIETIAAVAQHPHEPSLGNALASGFLVKRMIQYGESFNHHDGYLLASALLKAYPDPQEALFQSVVGQQLFSMGRTEDIALASLISVDPVVPELALTRSLKASEYGLSQDRQAYCFRAADGTN